MKSNLLNYSRLYVNAALKNDLPLFSLFTNRNGHTVAAKSMGNEWEKLLTTHFAMAIIYRLCIV